MWYGGRGSEGREGMAERRQLSADTDGGEGGERIFLMHTASCVCALSVEFFFTAGYLYFVRIWICKEIMHTPAAMSISEMCVKTYLHIFTETKTDTRCVMRWRQRRLTWCYLLSVY